MTSTVWDVHRQEVLCTSCARCYPCRGGNAFNRYDSNDSIRKPPRAVLGTYQNPSGRDEGRRRWQRMAIFLLASRAIEADGSPPSPPLHPLDNGPRRPRGWPEHRVTLADARPRGGGRDSYRCSPARTGAGGNSVLPPALNYRDRAHRHTVVVARQLHVLI